MDIEEALGATGGFGTVQRRLFWLNCAYQIVACYQLLLVTFVGSSPSWRCADEAASGDGDAERCKLYSSGSCEVTYEEGAFYSIVQEVKHVIKLSKNI